MSHEEQKQLVLIVWVQDACYMSDSIAATSEIEKAGYRVFNSALMPLNMLDAENRKSVMRALLRACDCACFLHGWEYDEEAKYLYGAAVALKKRAMTIDDFRFWEQMTEIGEKQIAEQ